MQKLRIKLFTKKSGVNRNIVVIMFMLERRSGLDYIRVIFLCIIVTGQWCVS